MADPMDTEKQVGSEQQQPQQQTTPNNNLKRPRDEDANNQQNQQPQFERGGDRGGRGGGRGGWRGGRGGGRGGGGGFQGDRRDKEKEASQIAANVKDKELLAAFKSFSETLDYNNDRRERIVKSSRDITIASKRVIFLLHRVLDTNDEQAKEEVFKQADADLTIIRRESIQPIALELSENEQDYWKYQRAFSPGLQEYIECVSFKHFLQTGKILTRDLAESDIVKDFEIPQGSTLTSVPKFKLGLMDFLLGLADMSGEMMRICVSYASTSQRDKCFVISAFLKDIYTGFSSLRASRFADLGDKMKIMKTSLDKVEQVCYNIRVRGSEAGARDFTSFGDDREQQTA